MTFAPKDRFQGQIDSDLSETSAIERSRRKESIPIFSAPHRTFSRGPVRESPAGPKFFQNPLFSKKSQNSQKSSGVSYKDGEIFGKISAQNWNHFFGHVSPTFWAAKGAFLVAHGALASSRFGKKSGATLTTPGPSRRKRHQELQNGWTQKRGTEHRGPAGVQQGLEFPMDLQIRRPPLHIRKPLSI